jgi:hypothetical protein
VRQSIFILRRGRGFHVFQRARNEIAEQAQNYVVVRKRT